MQESQRGDPLLVMLTEEFRLLVDHHQLNAIVTATANRQAAQVQRSQVSKRN